MPPPAAPWASGKADDGPIPEIGEKIEVDQLPEPIRKVHPDHPDAARDKGVEGTVLMYALVGRDGLVREIRVTKSVPLLDAAARSAVALWRFKPAMAKGEPVMVWVSVPVAFRLHWRGREPLVISAPRGRPSPER